METNGDIIIWRLMEILTYGDNMDILTYRDYWRY